MLYLVIGGLEASKYTLRWIELLTSAYEKVGMELLH